jgi:uncharacterized protein YacL
MAEYYAISLIMILAGLIGCKPLFPEKIIELIEKIEGAKILFGSILLLGTLYGIISLVIKFNFFKLPLGIIVLIVFVIMFPLIVGFIFSYDFIITKTRKVTNLAYNKVTKDLSSEKIDNLKDRMSKLETFKDLSSEKINNLKDRMTKFETLFSAGLLFQGLFYFLICFAMTDIMQLVQNLLSGGFR